VLTLDRGSARRELYGGGGPVVVVLGAAQMVVSRCRAGLLGVVRGDEGGWHRPFIGPEDRFRGKNLPGDLGGDSGEVGRGGRRGQPWCCLDGTRRAGAADRGSSSQRRGGRRRSRRC
jgi:hypothetical protein